MIMQYYGISTNLCRSAPGVAHGRDIAWQFLQEHWDEYYKRLSSGSMVLTRIIEKATDTFYTEEKAKVKQIKTGD